MSRQEKNSEVNALLGSGANFEGKLAFDGTVRIDGHFVGEIDSRGTLIVGEEAQIDASIHVKSIVIHGQINGDVTAEDTIELRAPAVLRGNIAAPNVTIERGVIFDGTCHMEAHARDSQQNQTQQNEVMITPIGKSDHEVARSTQSRANGSNGKSTFSYGSMPELNV